MTVKKIRNAENEAKALISDEGRRPFLLFVGISIVGDSLASSGSTWVFWKKNTVREERYFFDMWENCGGANRGVVVKALFMTVRVGAVMNEEEGANAWLERMHV